MVAWKSKISIRPEEPLGEIGDGFASAGIEVEGAEGVIGTEERSKIDPPENKLSIMLATW